MSDDDKPILRTLREWRYSGAADFKVAILEALAMVDPSAPVVPISGPFRLHGTVRVTEGAPGERAIEIE